MPSTASFWLITSPLVDNDPDRQFSELASALSSSSASVGGVSLPSSQALKIGSAGLAQRLGRASFPDFKIGDLSSLFTVTDTLNKQDPALTGVVSKIVDAIRNLTSDDSESLSTHLSLDGSSPYEDLIFPESNSDDGWKWDRAKYRVEGRKLEEVVDALVSDVTAIDNMQKTRLGDYNLAKGALQQQQRKFTGNLTTRSLTELVSEEHFVEESEYLETLLVVVPKNLTKQWEQSYERLTDYVVPRTSTKIAQDAEFALYNVTIFKKVHDEFIQKARESKYTVREFHYDPEASEKEQGELTRLEEDERTKWKEALRVSRVNFHEAFHALVHLKAVRTYVESVLRYGLPADYFAVWVKPDPKQARKLLAGLNSYFDKVVPKASKKDGKEKKGGGDAELSGEYQSIMDQEYFSFVLYEVPQVETRGE